jgi:CHAD domain-containing protein
MRDFVRLQTSIRLRRLATAVDRERRTRDQAALHDLRVAIRRLRRRCAANAFRPVYQRPIGPVQTKD